MNIIIYLVAFLEGFTTLGVEIIALRLFTPIIGTSSISTSIVLGVVLLALSYGYYIGGKKSLDTHKITYLLVRNLLFAGSYYFFISFSFYTPILEYLLLTTKSYFIAVLLASIILFFLPVFYASQTIPMLGEIMRGSNSGEKFGKLLFFSTVGSFLGAVGTSSFLFPLFGVYKSAIIISLILAICTVIISHVLIKDTQYRLITGVFTVFFLFSALFSSYHDASTIYKKANSYHTIHIKDVGDKRLFLLNDAYASGIDIQSRESFFQYIQASVEAVEYYKPKNILVIGAAGFTFPEEVARYDFVESVDVVDVDKSLKQVAEEYFLEKELSEKINFYPLPSRFFLNTIEKKYDFIFVDVYSGDSIPPQVLTQEFFQDLQVMSDSIYFNIIMDSNFKSNFSRSLFSTLQSVFGEIYTKDVSNSVNIIGNVMISNKKLPDYKNIGNTLADIYTDNQHSIELDLFRMRQEVLR